MRRHAGQEDGYMYRIIGLCLLVVAMSMTTGCTKHKKRAERLEAELLRCQNALQKARSSQVDSTGKPVELAMVDCGEGEL